MGEQNCLGAGYGILAGSVNLEWDLYAFGENIGVIGLDTVANKRRHCRTVDSNLH